MNIFEILIPKIKVPVLSYQSDIDYSIGQLVIVPFRNKEITGMVWKKSKQNLTVPLKSIIKEHNFNARVSFKLIDFINKAHLYYLSDLGSIAKLVLPVDINEKPIKTFAHTREHDAKLAKLSAKQNECLNAIINIKKPLVIKGVTGSGKTEVYFHAIMHELKVGNQALIMLPEIALSKQIIARFVQRFGFKPAIWNSGVTKAKKKQILRGIVSGDVKIVIGARSALFLPYKKLGITIVDEEHDGSYKQSDGVIYNARDMAVMRGKIEGSKTLLVSATPSIESLHNSLINKYDLFSLPSRHNKASLPTVEIVNMKEETLAKNNWLSNIAAKEIKENFSNKQQTLIFLNRKGYAPLMLCKACGYKAHCESCSASMVIHKKQNRLECHHCGYTLSIYTKCPECLDKDSLIMCGPGIERIEEEIKRKFTNCNVVTISKEESSSEEKMQQMLSDMENGEIDILIGTQIITKGYHFPKLTLVIVIDADIGFIGGDLRSSERTFQLLHQVGGRAGREDIKGKVLLQSYMPDNKVLQSIKNHQEEEYIDGEISSRKESNMPPFSRVATITITGKNDLKTKELAHHFTRIAPKSSAKIMGPSEAMMHKIAGKYRYKILIIANKSFDLQSYIRYWQNLCKIPSSYNFKIDIDPQELW
ncbi:MAG: hypothetical protein DGJ47_001004 [Rickettsiaceae bacterium]